MTITLQQAKNLKRGTILRHKSAVNADSTPQRFKVNGIPQTWVRSPNRVSVPLKRGLREYGYMTEHDLDDFELAADE